LIIPLSLVVGCHILFPVRSTFFVFRSSSARDRITRWHLLPGYNAVIIDNTIFTFFWSDADHELTNINQIVLNPWLMIFSY
jgi:hypothetical protein